MNRPPVSGVGGEIAPELPGRSSQRTSPRGSPPPPCSIPAGERISPSQRLHFSSRAVLRAFSRSAGTGQGVPHGEARRRRGPPARSRSPLPPLRPKTCGGEGVGERNITPRHGFQRFPTSCRPGATKPKQREKQPNARIGVFPWRRGDGPAQEGSPVRATWREASEMCPVLIEIGIGIGTEIDLESASGLRGGKGNRSFQKSGRRGRYCIRRDVSTGCLLTRGQGSCKNAQ